jgi:hypothetical protein
MTIATLVSGCGNAYPGDRTRDGGGQAGRAMGEQYANGWRVTTWCAITIAALL